MRASFHEVVDIEGGSDTSISPAFAGESRSGDWIFGILSRFLLVCRKTNWHLLSRQTIEVVWWFFQPSFLRTFL
jgi:hypothetical protein